MPAFLSLARDTAKLHEAVIIIIIIIIIIMMTSYAPQSSKIKLSGAIKPRD